MPDAMPTRATSHADTALDQLRLADDIATGREEIHAGFLVAAQVHALLAVAEEIRRAGHTPEPFGYFHEALRNAKPGGST